MARSATARRASDPFSSLEDDHRKVARLFERLSSAKAGSARSALLLQIKDALDRHAVLEENILYPALRSTPTEEAQRAATAGYDEHEGIRGTLAGIEGTDPESDLFMEQCRRLQGQVGRHVQREEDEILPAARRHVSARRLRDLAVRLSTTRAERMNATPDPAAPAPKKRAT